MVRYFLSSLGFSSINKKIVYKTNNSAILFDKIYPKHLRMTKVTKKVLTFPSSFVKLLLYSPVRSEVT